MFCRYFHCLRSHERFRDALNQIRSKAEDCRMIIERVVSLMSHMPLILLYTLFVITWGLTDLTGESMTALHTFILITLTTSANPTSCMQFRDRWIYETFSKAHATNTRATNIR